MSDLYEDDIVLWSERQAELLHRLARGERVNDQVDWNNVIEEIESVGREERRAVTSALMRGMQHKLYLLGWPNAIAVRHWQSEVRVHLADASEDFRESMRKDIDMTSTYRRARLATERHIIDEGPPAVALPADCPWSLDELLAEGKAALNWMPATKK